MPFTLAHAAAALPFRRTRLILTALIIGTLAPDFEYFLELDRGHGYGHTLPGAFLLDLPLTLAILWLFQRYVRTASISLMPNALRVQVAPEPAPLRLSHPATLALVLFSALVGIATHIAWDQFTHFNTWPYRQWSFLRHLHQVPILGFVQNYKILQHGSTLVGCSVLALWILAWHRRAPTRRNPVPANPQRGTLLLTFLVVATAGAFARAWIARHVSGSFVGRWVVTFIPLLWLQLVVYALWLDRRRPVPPPAIDP